MANLDSVHMRTAMLYAENSKAVRKKVGAVIVTASGVILPGYNGTPMNTPNECEKKVWVPNEGPWGDNGEYLLVTKPEVIHAELNCVLKAAREGVSIMCSTVYVTLSPCVSCAAMLIQSGVYRVVYDEEYRDHSGIEYLSKHGILVERYTSNG